MVVCYRSNRKLILAAVAGAMLNHSPTVQPPPDPDWRNRSRTQRLSRALLRYTVFGTQSGYFLNDELEAQREVALSEVPLNWCSVQGLLLSCQRSQVLTTFVPIYSPVCGCMC